MPLIEAVLATVNTPRAKPEVIVEAMGREVEEFKRRRDNARQGGILAAVDYYRAKDPHEPKDDGVSNPVQRWWGFQRQLVDLAQVTIAVAQSKDIDPLAAQLTKLLPERPRTTQAEKWREYRRRKPVRQLLQAANGETAILTLAKPVMIPQDAPARAALYLVNYMLGGNKNACLVDWMRSKLGLSYGVSAQFLASARGSPGLWIVQADLPPRESLRGEKVLREAMDACAAVVINLQNASTAARTILQRRQTTVSLPLARLVQAVEEDRQVDPLTHMSKEEFARVDISHLNWAMRELRTHNLSTFLAEPRR
jgi:hypothetical protein